MGSPNQETTQLGVLVQRAVADEPGAFDELAEHSTQRLRVLVRSMLSKYPHVRRWEDTEDVLQAALMRLYRSLQQVRPESTQAFFRFAVTQIRRELIDLARHYYGAHGHGAHHQSRGDGKAADDMGGVVAEAADPGDRPESVQDWARFHEAIESLPADERDAFSMVWYGGIQQKEAARLLKISERTITRRLNRARTSLRLLLSGSEMQTD